MDFSVLVTKRRKPRFDWMALNNFSSIPILKLGYLGTIAIPVIAILVDYVNDANRFVQAALGAVVLLKKFDLAEIAEAITRISRAFLPNIHLDLGLIFLYTGSASLATGRLIYSIRCPRIIKDHGTFSAYLRDLLELSLHLERINYLKMETGQSSYPAIREGKSKEIEHDAKGRLELFEDRATSIVKFSLRSDVHTMIEEAEDFWYQQNSSRRIARFVSFLFYSITALCAMVLFFYMAPIRVCYATSFDNKCRALDRKIKSYIGLPAERKFKIPMAPRDPASKTTDRSSSETQAP